MIDLERKHAAWITIQNALKDPPWKVLGRIHVLTMRDLERKHAAWITIQNALKDPPWKVLGKMKRIDDDRS